MTNLKKYNWKQDYYECLDFDGLKSIYSPPSKFRVSEFHYPAGEVVEGSMRKGKCFVVRGACYYKYRDNYEVELKSGEYVELPEGTYKLIVGEQSDLYIILVWEIPSRYWVSEIE